MNEKYIISVDQSTQGTKALLLDPKGQMICRTDLPHEQIISEKGWVSHNPEEIYQNTISVIKNLLEKSGVAADKIAGLSISNQRETSVIFAKGSGKPLANAIVWQCSRATELCEREGIAKHADEVREKTGITLSPYFPAAKIAWLLENTDGAMDLMKKNEICCGTIDTYLVYRLTGGKSYKTDYSNASRTQLFNIFELKWDEEICGWFGIDKAILPEVVDSNSLFGMTTCEGIFEEPIPIHGVLGDSHAALFGQNCRTMGMTKATYGTGSSIMMNIGTTPAKSTHGLVTSLAWGQNGTVEYVLEGNLNYTGATITWMKDNAEWITSPAETEALARKANPDDGVYLIPAFTGLGAPYWKSNARAAVIGMDRTTGHAELVRAGLECIAYQISDIVEAMQLDADLKLAELRVDGGPTGNAYLMQFQSDMLGTNVAVPDAQELSGIGVGYMAGMALGLWGDEVFGLLNRKAYSPAMEAGLREKKLDGWKHAVEMIFR